MARRSDPGVDSLYAAADQIRNAVFAGDDSVFVPGSPIWTLNNLYDLRARVVDNPDEGEASFEVRLAGQLQGATDGVKQLAAEVLFLYCWIVSPAEMGADRKAALIESVLDQMHAKVVLPNQMRVVLGQGIVRTGIAYHAGRYAQFHFILAAVSAWKQRPESERSGILADAWAFKAFLESVGVKMAGPMRMALLHLVFPDVFEPIVSAGEKLRIAKAFATHVAAGTGDVDRQLLDIRKALTPTYGEGFNFWSDALKEIWKSEANKWDAFIGWAKRLTLAEERDYKLKIAQKMATARSAVVAGSADWLDSVKAGFGHPNNLVSHFIWLPFMKACTDAPDRALAELRGLWTAPDPLSATFMEWDFNPAKVSRPGRTALAALLLMGRDATTYPPFKKSAFQRACRLVGFPEMPLQSQPAEAYAHALEFLDELVKQARQRGLEIEDRLDAQGILWQIAEGGPNAAWPEADVQALTAYRAMAGKVPTEPEFTEVVPEVSEGMPHRTLADELLVTESFIDDVHMLLEHKRQVIFYGPPGTGKTYLAQRLARHFAGSEQRVKLVQFHPSYAYEDFVEGYRPKESGFALVDGPLKAIAASAADGQRHVMIIDEINRANPARVLGELYFLLEYRKHSMRLQYSQEDFALPENLWFIGTMNTADRSIASLDAALRRRFYFVPFFPDEEPFDTMLKRWLERHKPELLWVDAVVREANLRLADRHASIGPSHFMREELTEAWVEKIWRYSVLPYVEERLVGQTERMAEFELQTLRARVQATA